MPKFALAQAEMATFQSQRPNCDSELLSNRKPSFATSNYLRLINSYLSQFPNQSAVAKRIQNATSKMNPFQFAINGTEIQFKAAIDDLLASISEKDWLYIREAMNAHSEIMIAQSLDRESKNKATSTVYGLELRSKLELQTKDTAAPLVINVGSKTYMIATRLSYFASREDVTQQIYVYEIRVDSGEFKLLLESEVLTERRPVEAVVEGGPGEILIVTGRGHRLPQILRYDISANTFEWLSTDTNETIEDESAKITSADSYKFRTVRDSKGQLLIFFANRTFFAALEYKNRKLQVIDSVSIPVDPLKRVSEQFTVFDSIEWKGRNFFILGKQFLTYDENDRRIWKLAEIPRNKNNISYKLTVLGEHLYISTLFQSTQDFRWDGWDINAGRLKPVSAIEPQLTKVLKASQIYRNDLKNKIILYRYAMDLFVLSTESNTVTQLPLDIDWGIHQKPVIFEEEDGRLRLVYFKGDEILEFEYRDHTATLLKRLPIRGTPVSTRFQGNDGLEYLLARSGQYIYILSPQKRLKRAK